MLTLLSQSDEGEVAVLPVAPEDEEARVTRELQRLEQEVEADLQLSYGSGHAVLQSTDEELLTAQSLKMADDMQREASGAIDEEDIIITDGSSFLDSDAAQAMPPAATGGALPAGLLFCDGRDSMGRPVVVVRPAMMPTSSTERKAVMEDVRATLTPVVETGPYVLLFVHESTEKGSSWSARSPLMLLSSFRSLGRPFKKNVQYVLFHQPTTFMRYMLGAARPFMSSKASRKWRTIQAVREIEDHTNGEVRLGDLGSAIPHVQDL